MNPAEHGSATHHATPDPPAHRAPTAHPVRTGWGRVLAIGLGLAVLVGVLVTAFAWPAVESKPRDIPIAVVGPPEAAAQVEQQLDTAVPGGFAVKSATDPEAARHLIRNREVYGAIVLDPAGPPQLMTASAAGPAVAQVLQMLATEMAQQGAEAPAVQVEDVVPLSDEDPRGAGFAAAALPMVLGGLIVGLAMSFGVAGVWRGIAGALLAAVAAGLAITLVVQTWFGALEGSYWANAGVISLTTFAIATALIGLYSVIGLPGIGLGWLLLFLLGNPLSGMASAPEMLPSGWGTLGQLLPPGAGGTLLRSTAYFDGAAATTPVLVLTAWVVGGLILAALGRNSRWATHHGRP